MTNLKSETTTNQEQGKKIEADDPWLHALRSEEEQQWRCGGIKTISPFSPCMSVSV